MLNITSSYCHSLGGYPCNSNETIEQSLQHTFIYGDLQFGPVSKKVYTRAIRPGNALPSDEPVIGCEVCVLVGSKDFEKFKDSLTSTTFVLETHDEDICRRAFNCRNADKYTELFKEEEGGAGASPAVSPRAVKTMGSKTMSKQASAAPSEPEKSLPPNRSIAAKVGSMTAIDEFLVQCICAALSSAALLRAHGTARFRLEKLLETSPDILQRFQEKRGISPKEKKEDDVAPGLPLVQSYLTDTGLIFAEDELMLEVTEAKARKPDRWQMPGDLSLKSYLGKQKGAVIDGGTVTMNASKNMNSTIRSSVSTGTIASMRKDRPKYERFNASQTRLSIRVQLHRPRLDLKTILTTETIHRTILFKDPSAPPPAPVLHPVERKEIEQLKQKNAMIEASNKAKAAKLAEEKAATVSKVNIAPVPPENPSEESLDGNMVSEGSPREAKKSPRAKSPRSTKSSPRPKSAIKESKEPEPEPEPPKTIASVEVNPYDRENALQKLLESTPYTRMVFLFKYDNDNVLEALNHALNAVNMRALPNIQGTVRSYSLSQEEEQAANNGELDIVCGFSIIDDDTRMVVLEGLAGYDKGMESVFIDMPRFNVNDNDVKILSNPEVLFPHRIYTEYGPDIKRIRPREKLKILVQKPELYDRKQVDQVCFEALEKIMELRRATELQQTKELTMYPSAESLNKMELLYGEAISKEDIEGSRAIRAKRALRAKKAGGVDNSTITASYGTEEDSKKILVTGANSSHAGEVSAYGVNSVEFKHRVSRLAETDCWNDLFVERLAQRDFAHPKHNFVMEQRELRRQAWRRGLERRAQRDAEDRATLERLKSKNPSLQSGLLHGYASQSMNIKDMLLSDTRDRLKDDRTATYTYSRDFASQNLVLVDEYADRLKIQAAHKANNVSKKGFIYPAPKTREELIAHPKKPSAIRVEELHTPFPGEEMEFIDSSGRTMLPEIREVQLKNRELERNFDNKLNGNKLFGMLEPPVYERDFELSAIGDRTRLPRGQMTGGIDQNPIFWRSVHASGDEGIKLQERIKQEEKEAWQSKVVVETQDFKVGNFKVKDKAAQWQRHEDILKDEPKTKAFKYLRTEKKYETLPIAVMTQGEYIPNAAAKALIRAENKDKFITSTEILPGTNGVPKDFTRYINKHTDKPKVQRKVHKLKHPELVFGSADLHGPKWGNHVRSDL